MYSSADGLDLSGVEISATAFGNSAHQQMLVPLPYWQQAVWLLIWLSLLWFMARSAGRRVVVCRPLAWALLRGGVLGFCGGELPLAAGGAVDAQPSVLQLRH